LQLGWDLALGCTIAAMLAGVWFAYLSWQLTSPMFGMLAVLLVLAGPALAVAVVVARPDASGEEGESPESLLVDGIRRTDAALRIVKLGRAHVGVICSYVVILWLCEAGGMVSLKGFLVFFTFACAVTAIAYLPWLASRERRLYEERAALQQRLGEIEAGEFVPR
jgi:MFS family permease